MSSFHVGQRVVCIAGPHYHPYAHLVPAGNRDAVIGCVYTVRGPTTWGDGIYLEEIVNPRDVDGDEWGFWVDRFRPVKDTSIEIFLSLLSPVPEEVA